MRYGSNFPLLLPSSSFPFLFLVRSFPKPSQKCMELSNTKQVRTYCKWGVSHYDGTPCSQDHLIGEDYAKMKAGPCKKSQNTLEDPRKTMENGAAQTKSEGQNIHGAFQFKTGAYFMHMEGGATLRWHTDRTRWGNERLFHGRNASFRVCHLIAAPYMYVYILYI